MYQAANNLAKLSAIIQRNPNLLFRSLPGIQPIPYLQIILSLTPVSTMQKSDGVRVESFVLVQR